MSIMKYGWLRKLRGEIREVTTAMSMQDGLGTFQYKSNKKDHSRTQHFFHAEWKTEKEGTIPKLSKMNWKFVFPLSSGF